jgi:hypothetical protein
MSKANPSLNLIDTKGLATAINKPISAVQRMARLRLIPSIRIGHRTRLYDVEAVRRALLKRTTHELD